MQTITHVQADETSALSLISEAEFGAVVTTVLRDHDELERSSAERIVKEALKFVAACAAIPGERLRSSRAVDKGWHALILHTHTYARLCSRLGRFVHHMPDPPAPAGTPAEALERTPELMTTAGYVPDRTLWLQFSEAAKCCDYCPFPPKGN
ncbi:glycine-rich domain-containing protein [Streptomyces sp. NPDC050988]|uniref:glycine-rich domain-containing protein n=1 Tax=Streptomyces sp. NPDC050988 TaxID=3365637 RepID=UPI00379FCA3D